jgi:hypothetical protein
MAREPQRANDSESLAPLSMSNGPGRYDPIQSPSRAGCVGGRRRRGFFRRYQEEGIGHLSCTS